MVGSGGEERIETPQLQDVRWDSSESGAQRPPEVSGRREISCLCVGFVVPGASWGMLK